MNGFFNINKPVGISSAKAVWQIKNKLKIKDKIGHTGTLDPLASGVLVVAVGKANRLFEKLLNKTKKYQAVFDFGYQTITIDNESTELAFENGKIPTLNEINECLPKMLGKQQQVAPIFSAKNINGQRAYQIARNGENVEIKPHNIEIFDIKCLKQCTKSQFLFEIFCSSGTYIRSICKDLATNLDTYATMTKLIRTESGNFNIKNSVSIEDVQLSDLIDISYVLDDLKTIQLDEEVIQDIKNGKTVKTNQDDGEYNIKLNNITVGIGLVKDKIIKIKPWLI